MNAIGERPRGAGLIRLRRLGRRPLCFEGRLVARHAGERPGETGRDAAVWHELALYQVESGGFATEITAWHAPPGPPLCHAELAATLDAALTRFETHDASADLWPGRSAPCLRFDDPTISPAELQRDAAELARRRAELVRRYRMAVGSFLAELAGHDFPCV